MLTLCTSLFVAPTVSGETYYVSLKGDDANDGRSEAAAFRTITKGVSVVRAGETVIIQSGDYGSEQAVLDSSGRKDAPIVIEAEEPGKVILRGAGDGAGLRLKNKHYVVIEGLEFTNYSAGLTISRASSYITVRKCIFRNNRGVGLSLRGNKSSPTDSHHHLFTENQFLDLTPAYEGLTPGSDVRDTQDYGVYLYFATDVEVLNNYFHGHHHQALSFKKLMWNSRVAGNVFEGFQLSAMYLGQNTDSEEEGDLRCYNLVAEGNTFRPAPGYRAKTAIAVANVTGAIVRNNFMDSIYGEDAPGPTSLPGGGIHVHAMAVGTKIHNNVLVDVKDPKAALMIRADCEIYNNTIAGCDRGLEIAEGVKAVVRNNIFYENRKHLGVAEPLGPKYAEYFGYVMQEGVMVKIPVDASKKSVFGSNLWFPKRAGEGTHGISADPRFVGPISPIVIAPASPKFVPDFERARAYRLAKGSPCIDKGVEVGLPFGGKAPDLGAFEFGSEE